MQDSLHVFFKEVGRRKIAIKTITYAFWELMILRGISRLLEKAYEREYSKEDLARGNYRKD